MKNNQGTRMNADETQITLIFFDLSVFVCVEIRVHTHTSTQV